MRGVYKRSVGEECTKGVYERSVQEECMRGVYERSVYCTCGEDAVFPAARVTVARSAAEAESCAMIVP
jgi:hypothetical protein